jgi:hypothetical protein
MRAARSAMAPSRAPDLARIMMGAEEVADIVARLERLRVWPTPTARGRDLRIPGQRPRQAAPPSK